MAGEKPRPEWMTNRPVIIKTLFCPRCGEVSEYDFRELHREPYGSAITCGKCGTFLGIGRRL